ncbi:MAG: lipid II flippase MurJ, partial [Arachnia propionica]
MAAGTLVSRTLGLIRVMLIAFILGNGTRQADMLSLATTIPNSLYILFAGGALNTVLVPQIVRAAKDDADGGEAYINRIMTAFLGIVALVAMIATLAAPLITMLYSSGGWREPELAAQYTSLIALTYLTLPQIFFYGAFFLLAQVLNAREKFGPMMWAPIANNVISILVLSTYLVVWGNREDHATAFTAGQVWLLGLGSTLGIACQLLVLLPFLKKVGFKFRPRFDLRGTGLGKTFSLAKWTIGFVLINQIALIIIQRLATSATATG